ncbi:Binding-protein-dependent transport systems inner membrane component [Planctomycetales bacterium 10988]|nr:Binding-protein-dependent transport systems inner membrane component [Planctomycetales bacterium 10988]
MINYFIRRTLIGFITLLCITFIIFGLIRNMPGTPLTLDMAESDPSKQISDADLKRLERIYGLDKPWYISYFQWLGNLAQLDMGQSIARKVPVTRLIGQRIGPTFLLSATSLLLAYLLSIPIGLYSTVRGGKWDERAISVMLYMLYSIPSYVTALILLFFFAVTLQDTVFALPLQGIVSDGYQQMSYWEKVRDVTWHMILPVICFTYGGLAYYSRFIRSNMEEVIRQDYIRTAKAKGVPFWRIILHHAFRNTMIPFVTMIGLTLPALLSGSVILESIFGWPGMGQLFLESIVQRDYPTVMGITLMFSFLTLLGQLLADFLYAVVDPRVTYQ